MKTVLITGCSSGYGLETARHFLAKGWNVIATMRVPCEDILPKSERLRILPLDVTKPESIAEVIRNAGPIDMLVNNAGIGLIGAFEATPMEKVRQIFETNTFGVMAMTQAVIPQMRERRSGMIVNVTSSVTLAPMPLVSVYAASKFAIEGFTSSLEPGYGPSTRFTQNTDVRIEEAIPKSYMAFAAPLLESFAKPALVTTAEDVADVVWYAANDESEQLRYPAGPDAVALIEAA